MTDRDVDATIEALLQERRTFLPPDEFTARANLSDASIYADAERDPDGYWAGQAARLDWFEPWDTVLERDPPHHRWFVGGRLNVAHNCIDRHLATAGDRVAYHWIGEPGETRTVTYPDLHVEVCRLANALTGLGIAKRDRVAIYLPMIPELPLAMLACARIGAPHSGRLRGVLGGSTARPDKRRRGE